MRWSLFETWNAGLETGLHGVPGVFFLVFFFSFRFVWMELDALDGFLGKGMDGMTAIGRRFNERLSALSFC